MTGDRVEVVGGPEAGKQGTVRAVLRNRNKVLVDGINMVCPRTFQLHCSFLIILSHGFIHHSHSHINPGSIVGS